MMAQIVDRKYLKAQMRELLSSAQVSPKAMAALYLLLSIAIGFLAALGGLPGRYQAAEGPCPAPGCLFTLDSTTGLCTAVERIEIR